MKKTLAFDEAVSFRWYDEDGRMHVDRSNLTRVQVAPYRGSEIPDWEGLNLDPVKIYYGYRPASELGKPETIKSVIGIPIQLNHHADTPDAPAMDTRVGSTGDHAEFDGQFLSNSLHIQNEDACRRIRDGSMRELSLAYYYTPDFKSSGEYEGQKYDFTMRDIRGQHLALVEEGRAGKSCLVEDSALKGVKAMNDKTAPNGATDTDHGEEKAEIKVADAMSMLSELLRNLHKGAAEEGVSEDEGEDKDAKIEKITAEFAKLGADEKAIEDLKAALVDLAKADAEQPAEDEGEEAEEPVKAEDEEEAEQPAEDEEEGGKIDDVARDALKSCGLDAEDPEIQKAFAAGIKHGETDEEKADPEAAEDEGEEAPEPKATAEDAALKMERKWDAIETCRPILGNVRRAAFDSAEGVYMAALKQAGFPMKGVRKENAQALLCGYLAGKAAKRGMANDAKPQDVESAGLARVVSVRLS